MKTTTTPAATDQEALRILGRLLADINKFNRNREIGSPILWTSSCLHAMTLLRGSKQPADVNQGVNYRGF
jgi:hypothetical protein